MDASSVILPIGLDLVKVLIGGVKNISLVWTLSFLGHFRSIDIRDGIGYWIAVLIQRGLEHLLRGPVFGGILSLGGGTWRNLLLGGFRKARDGIRTS
jgi:hypothetical protein